MTLDKEGSPHRHPDPLPCLDTPLAPRRQRQLALRWQGQHKDHLWRRVQRRWQQGP